MGVLMHPMSRRRRPKIYYLEALFFKQSLGSITISYLSHHRMVGDSLELV